VSSSSRVTTLSCRIGALDVSSIGAFAPSRASAVSSSMRACVITHRTSWSIGDHNSEREYSRQTSLSYRGSRLGAENPLRNGPLQPAVSLKRTECLLLQGPRIFARNPLRNGAVATGRVAKARGTPYEAGPCYAQKPASPVEAPAPVQEHDGLAARRRAIESRRAQGLPDAIEDAEAIRAITTIFRTALDAHSRRTRPAHRQVA
jgi:hypothetical protein